MKTRIMGILNVTPDSFSDGGRYFDVKSAVRRAGEMAREGADIIDIGGESSRPGSRRISSEEELDRVLPVVEALADAIDKPISVDTYKGLVARRALEKGAAYINDITALSGDDEMAGIISRSGAGVVLMHMKGDPETMQDSPFYRDVVGEISVYLQAAVHKAEAAGIDPAKIIIDPGIGFGKTLEHNLEILNRLAEFKKLGKPVLVGVSRKSFIGALTGKDAGGRLLGTASSVSAAVLNGADMVRVHDVAEMREVARVAEAIAERKIT